MADLQSEFNQRLRAALRECHELGYHPTRFEQMLESKDGVQVAKQLVKSGELQDGLKKLKQMSRLDLAMEHLMLEPSFSPLFTQQELAAADWRLKQLQVNA